MRHPNGLRTEALMPRGLCSACDSGRIATVPWPLSANAGLHGCPYRAPRVVYAGGMVCSTCRAELLDRLAPLVPA